MFYIKYFHTNDLNFHKNYLFLITTPINMVSQRSKKSTNIHFDGIKNETTIIFDRAKSIYSQTIEFSERTISLAVKSYHKKRLFARPIGLEPKDGF